MTASLQIHFSIALGEIAPGIKISRILMRQWIHTFSWCPASVSHFVGEAELNPLRVVSVGLDREAAIEATASANTTAQIGCLLHWYWRPEIGQRMVGHIVKAYPPTALRSVKIVLSQEAVYCSNQRHNTLESSGCAVQL